MKGHGCGLGGLPLSAVAFQSYSRAYANRGDGGSVGSAVDVVDAAAYIGWLAAIMAPTAVIDPRN